MKIFSYNYFYLNQEENLNEHFIFHPQVVAETNEIAESNFARKFVFNTI